MSEGWVRAREEIHDRGWTVLREAIETEYVEHLQALVTDELSQLGAIESRCDGLPVYRETDDIDAFTLPAVRHHELLERVSRGLLFSAASVLLQEEMFVHPNKWVRCMPPSGSEVDAVPSVHQDAVEVQGGPGCLTVWIPVFATQHDNGGLPVYDFGPRRYPLPLILCDKSINGWRIDENLLGKANCPALAAGDVLVFDSLTPHGGAVNSSDTWRISVEIRYQRLGEPLAETCLKPYGAASWESVYAGWNEYAFYWVDRHPITRPFDHAYDYWRDVESIQAARRDSGFVSTDYIRGLELCATGSGSEALRLLASDELRLRGVC